MRIHSTLFCLLIFIIYYTNCDESETETYSTDSTISTTEGLEYDEEDEIIGVQASVSDRLRVAEDEEYGLDYYETTDQVFLRDCLKGHNKYRRRHSVPSLKFDDELIDFARRRAIEIAISDGSKFAHPDNLTYGENLAWNSENSDVGCLIPIGLWYDEWKLYNYNSPAINTANGHFTQVVWANTLRVGCGQAVSYGKVGGTYTVCNYDPPGNWLNEEKENVKPATKSRRKSTKPTKSTNQTTRRKSTKKSTRKPAGSKKPRRA